ncbi:MAG: phosphohistidine phosphatase SixA [Gammaproteobacteria bacterium]
MPIYFSQHGKSASKDVDPQRGLTPDGAAEVTRIAKNLSEAGVAVDVIWHSGKARASQTAEIFAASLRPDGGVKLRDGIGPLDDVEAFAGELPKDRDEMIVGHLPFMERIVSFLVTGDAHGRVVAFQNAGVVRLDWDGEGQRWVIGSAVFPNA